VANPFENVFKLRIIFGESLSRAETWVYKHQISPINAVTS